MSIYLCCKKCGKILNKNNTAMYRNKFYCKECRFAMTKNEMASEAVKTVAEQFFNGSYIQLIKFVEKKTEELLV